MGVFATLENTFRWLVTGPRPLVVHPRRFPDLPQRPVPLDQLRALLASPAVCAASRAAVWSHLVRQARTPGPEQAAWTVAAAALALPDLMRIVGALGRRRPRRCPELEAAALGAFLSELRRVDHNDARDPRIRWLLLMSAYRGARTLRDTTGHTHTAPDTPATAPAAVTERARPRGPAPRRGGAAARRPAAARKPTRPRTGKETGR